MVLCFYQAVEEPRIELRLHYFDSIGFNASQRHHSSYKSECFRQKIAQPNVCKGPMSKLRTNQAMMQQANQAIALRIEVATPTAHTNTTAGTIIVNQSSTDPVRLAAILCRVQVKDIGVSPVKCANFVHLLMT